MLKRPLKAAFANRNYENVTAVLTHVDEISRAIRTEPKLVKKTRSLSPFNSRVLELAPRHFNGGYYSNFGIACAILGLKRKDIKKEELQKVKVKVSAAIAILQAKGLIEPIRWYRPQSAKKLRDATPAEIERHVGLIHAVLKKGHRFLSSNWRRHLSYQTAVEIGKEGLRKAIESHDPKTCAFSTHAFTKISAEIAKAAARKRREISLDKPIRDEKRTLHEVIGTTTVDPTAFETSDLELLLSSKRAKPHYIGVYALKHIYGHDYAEIARHFGTKRQAVQSTNSKAEEIIRRVKRARGIE
ncbi:MAG: hypothetical protein V1722_03130 [Candidatus Micrarchaeota archaeon]